MIANTSLSRVFIKSFFSQIRHNGIRFCVIHNIEEVKSGQSHDIDMCIEVSKLIEAEQLLKQTAQQLGWKMHLHTGNIRDSFNAKSYHFHLINEHERTITLIHFDFVPITAWRGREILPNEVMLNGVNSETLYPVSSPEVMAVVDLFPHLLYDNYIKEKYRPRIYRTFTERPGKVLQVMSNFLPEKLALQVLELVQQQRWNDILALRPVIVTQSLKHAKRRPLDYVRHILHKILHPTGIMTVFQGTDGSGKSSIIQMLPKILGNSFTGDTLNYYHWRPGFLKAEKKSDEEGNPITDLRPHTHPPDNRLRSFLKLGFYTLDYIFGYCFKVRKQLAQGHLVVFDRYFYDFYIDKIRYRLTISNNVIRFFHTLIPTPAITFLLVGDADKIYARKKEISAEEIQLQINRLHEYKHFFSNPIVIDVNQKLPDVCFDVCREILNKMSTRF